MQRSFICPRKQGCPMIRFEVEDAGIGMSPERCRTIFDVPTFTNQRVMGGTGLGLFCLAARITALKGE